MEHKYDNSIVYNADCMEIMRDIPDGYFELAVCDFPYGINVSKLAYTQEVNRPCKQKNGSILRVKKLGYEHKDWDNETPKQNYFDEIVRISKNQILFGIEYVCWSGVGSGRLKWVKGIPAGVSFKPYEMAYNSMIDYTEELHLLWAGMQQAKSINEPMTAQGNKKLNEKRIHPCHKPIMLYDIIYANYLPQGGKVFDSHLGSQSNRISAYKRGNIDFTACELDKDYFNDGNARFIEFVKKYQPAHLEPITANGQNKLF